MGFFSDEKKIAQHFSCSLEIPGILELTTTIILFGCNGDSESLMVCNMIFLLEFFSFFEFVNDSVCTLSEIHFPCTMVVIVVYPRMMYYIANRMIRKIKRHFLTGGRKNTNDHIILLEGKMCIAAICQYRSCHKVKECV